MFQISPQRSFPPKNEIEGNWLTAARHGLVRDHGQNAGTAFDSLTKTFVYFGDLSNHFLRNQGRAYDEANDVADRNACLTTLEGYATQEFIGQEGKRNYEGLPGKTSLKEFVADVAAGPLSFLGLSQPIIALVAPDMRQYWNSDAPFGSQVRWTPTTR